MWHLEDNGLKMSFVHKSLGLLFFFLVFLGGSYFNMYMLIPRLLFKNKWLSYFCSLVGMVLFVVTLVVLVQELVIKKDKVIDEINYILVVFNLLSSSLSIFFLFAGTTTLMLFKNWILDMKRAEELETATLQSELKLLESQINPHFLFNMLNNANIMIEENPDVASHIIIKLKDMLRYQMNDNTWEKVYLSEDILFLTDFLELEKTRRDYFTYSVATEGDIDNIQIPPLLFITFVENAVKHNLDSNVSSYVNIAFKVAEGKLMFICENSIPEKIVAKKAGGLGLTNIRRRLDLLYSDKYNLKQTKADRTYTVKLELKL
jgi:LytS/YehU family sensor histidine kinase